MSEQKVSNRELFNVTVIVSALGYKDFQRESGLR
jgi:hypothetical protein